jgi:hypothetical protein
MARKQVIVQLDEDLVRELDAEANLDGVSRSEIIRRAAHRYLEDAAEREADRVYAEAYRRIPQSEDWNDDYARLPPEELGDPKAKNTRAAR